MPDLVAEPLETKQLEERELGSMSILQHLEELRKRLIYSVAAVAVCFGVGWYYWQLIYTEMKKPVEAALSAHKLPTELGYLNPTDPLNLSLKIGLIAGI